MKKIILSGGEVALVSDVDHIFLAGFAWSCNNRGYAVAYDPRTKKMVSMHRLIMERMGHVDFEHTDHANQNKLDNQRENLRPATCSQNHANRGALGNSASGVKGVSWNKRDEKWRAQLKVDGKRKDLGSHDNIEDAARAYNAAAIKYFGEFAQLNEIGVPIS
jgi:hypothetical protein